MSIAVEIPWRETSETYIQPAQLWSAFDLNGFQAMILDRIGQHKTELGASDIDKAEDYFDLWHATYVEGKKLSNTPFTPQNEMYLERFLDQQRFGVAESKLIRITIWPGEESVFEFNEQLKNLRLMHLYEAKP
jgi:hypothetical protein